MHWEEWIRDDPVPSGSIYMWMYRAGLNGLPFDQLMYELAKCGKQPRDKDIQNWRNGWNKSWFTEDYVPPANPFEMTFTPTSAPRTVTSLSTYPQAQLEVVHRRWVPCNGNNKPMVKWSQTRLTREEVNAYPGCMYLAECMQDMPFIVFDIDGDHDGIIQPELISTFKPWIYKTHALIKPNGLSFHLMFRTDRVIPTQHFSDAHIDILGNARPQLRYRKNKRWNHVFPQSLTDQVWDQFMTYIGQRL